MILLTTMQAVIPYTSTSRKLSTVFPTMNYYSNCGRFHGITSNVLYRLKDYLTERNQCVSINRCSSTFLPVILGVHQGSILRPLLFVLYINDLPFHLLSSSLFLFADDTKRLKQILTPADIHLLQQDLELLSTWSGDWKLSFNEYKCLLYIYYVLMLSMHRISTNTSAHLSSDHQYTINGMVTLIVNQLYCQGRSYQ